MSVKDKFDMYVKGNNKNNSMEEIIAKLPDNETITKETLEKLNNKKTKMVLDDDIKGNYYIFLNDTIYLSNKGADKYKRLTVICHECVHSIQNKAMQLINFVLSNLEVIIFVIFAILKFLNVFGNILTYVYIASVVISVIPRFILEIHASIKSIGLTREYILDKIGEKESEFANKIVSFQVIALLPIMLLSLCLWKVIRVIIVAII